MGIVRAQRRVQQGSARAQFGAAEGPPALPATDARSRRRDAACRES